MRRALVPSSALAWGLQLALLNPSLALLLVALYDATPGQVGAVLAVYDAGGLVASLAIPTWADRRGDCLAPMLGCAVLTLALAGALSAVSALPLALVALVVLGGPAGVGSTLLFAHLKHSGASPAQVVGTRAVVSAAWVVVARLSHPPPRAGEGTREDDTVLIPGSGQARIGHVSAAARIPVIRAGAYLAVVEDLAAAPGARW